MEIDSSTQPVAYSAFFLILALLLGTEAVFSASITDEFQRKLFLKAEHAIKNNQQSLYQQLRPALVNYPLLPYLELERLSKNLSAADNNEITGFLQQQEGTAVAHLLRWRWLGYLAKRQRWQDYADFYQPVRNVTRQCHYLNALIQTGQKEQAFKLVSPLWRHGKSRPKACDPVFAAWQKSDQFTTDEVWHRIDLAMSRNNSSLAKYLKRFLDKEDQAWLQSWLRVHNKPERALTESKLVNSHAYKHKILAHAVYRQTRKDPLEGMELWDKIQKKYPSDQLTTHLVNRKLAARLIHNDDPAAYLFLSSIEPCSHDSTLQETRIRAALLREDWDKVRLWIDRLPPDQQSEERWRYWKARAMLASGQYKAAAKALQTLAQERSYYGFLAADATEMPYMLDNREAPASPEEVVKISRLPEAERTRELVALERWSHARREWRYLQEKLSQQELMAAAKLAESWDWHDQAIFTLAKTGYWDDLDLRFPLEHKGKVRKRAARTGLNPAWVYGVIRQESAFNPTAVSHAGAVGLMQLMPSTARMMAREMRQKTPSKRQLTDPDTNIKLGTNYLRTVLDKLDGNPVLATAAYNAGPHRVERWLPEQTLAADIWVELIPYKETRTYVKRVLTYAAIYDYRLGQKTKRLSKRMPFIEGTARKTAMTEKKLANL